MIRYLSDTDVLYIHEVLAIVFREDGDPIEPSGPRDPEASLVSSAAGRPRVSLGGVEKYRTVEAKAAALFHSLVQNHAFHNGNKRTALVSMVRFLDMNERRIEATDRDLFKLVTSIAKGQLPDVDGRQEPDELVAGIEEWLKHRCKKVERANGEVRVAAFLEKIEEAGGRVKSSADRSAWILHGPVPGGKSVRISKSTGRLAGMVARVYAKKIGFTDGQSGISFDDLSAGVQPEQRIIGDLIEVLRMLAHT